MNCYNNSIIANSAADDGGGMFGYASSPTIQNNTIVANSAGRDGGGLHLDACATTIANTIIAFNSSGIYRRIGTRVLRHNCVYGNTEYDFSGLPDPTGTNGNVAVDPLFIQAPDPGPDGIWGTVDDLPGNLHIWPESPCVDAGYNAFVVGLFDLGGLPRIVDGDDDGVSNVDIGAYESPVMPPICAGDANCDGVINWRDIDFFIAAMNDNRTVWAELFAPGGPTCPFASNDVNADGTVNWRDIDPLVALMNTACP